ncbi:hypothetical protein rsdtw13_05280 [Clostridium sp. TW13]|uniref:Uncharacterized protein n=1 Tax=Inconstantimicrobium mannanitabidum TaxID=1604901 RepID=A0ACB5R866_9CLOT|nr:hypothetical protein rsdtw13_05280 [Clostridium sp. TW13]
MLVEILMDKLQKFDIFLPTFKWNSSIQLQTYISIIALYTDL